MIAYISIMFESFNAVFSGNKLASNILHFSSMGWLPGQYQRATLLQRRNNGSAVKSVRVRDIFLLSMMKAPQLIKRLEIFACVFYCMYLGKKQNKIGMKINALHNENKFWCFSAYWPRIFIEMFNLWQHF